MKITEKIKMDKAGLMANGAITIVVFGDSVSHGSVGFDEPNDYESVYHNRLRKKILAVRKTCIVLHIITWIATLAAIAAVMYFGYVENVDQYGIIALQVLLTQPAFLATMLILPKKKYFAVRNGRKSGKKEKEKNREEK